MFVHVHEDLRREGSRPWAYDHVVFGEAPPNFPDKVSDGLPDIMPGWAAPEFR